MDCDLYRQFCTDNGINSFPAFRTYAPGGSKAGGEAFGNADVWHSDGLEIVANTVKVMAAAAREKAAARDDSEFDDLFNEDKHVHEGL